MVEASWQSSGLVAVSLASRWVVVAARASIGGLEIGEEAWPIVRDAFLHMQRESRVETPGEHSTICRRISCCKDACTKELVNARLPYKGTCNECWQTLRKGGWVLRCAECGFDVCGACSSCPVSAELIKIGLG